MAQKVGIILTLIGAFLVIAPLPFSVRGAQHDEGVMHFVGTGTTRLREPVAIPRFANVAKGHEDPDAKEIEYEKRRPIIEVPKNLSDEHVAAILRAAFPKRRAPLVDPNVELVRFTGWEIQREAIEVPYRFLLVSGIALVLAGAGALLWPRGRGSRS